MQPLLKNEMETNAGAEAARQEGAEEEAAAGEDVVHGVEAEPTKETTKSAGVFVAEEETPRVVREEQQQTLLPNEMQKPATPVSRLSPHAAQESTT
jgi:hypothetical protein